MIDKVKLNKTALAGLVAVDGKQTVYWDTELTGFGVRVSNGRMVPKRDRSGNTIKDESGQPVLIREYGYSFFCQGRLKGHVIKVTIGKSPTFSPEMARKNAREYLGKMAAGQDPRIVKDTRNGSATFGEMMHGYAEWMKQQGKVSAHKVKQEIDKDIQAPFKTLWRRPANLITVDDCDRIIARLENDKKPRQADKIRSYIKAAFRKAINSRRNRAMPEGLKLADIKTNPCSDIEKVQGSGKTSGRALSLAEFQAFWGHVKELPEPGRSIMMLFVLTGGQRERQLNRTTLHSIDRDAPSIEIADIKGRRSSAYVHIVPLLPEALDCIERITGAGEFVFSCDGGRRPISDSYIGKRVDKIREAMEKAGELPGGHFTPKCIRKTVETQLVARPYRVSTDVLAHLESHGQGGIQAKHYQRHNYFEEKREALEMLQRMVEGKPEPSAQIIQFDKEARA